MDTEDLINAKTLIDTSIDRGYRFREGSEFDQYLLRSQLGRGALGEVYEAEHKVLGKFFALKILKIDLKSSSGLKKSFEREARVMASLEHLRILKVDDFRITDDLPWLRMELCRGFKKDLVTLAHFDEKNAGKINEGELIEMLQQILDGLEYAHGRGVIHRDLKPANILLFPGKDDIPEIKIADFGLVKMVGEEWLHSQAQMSLTQSMGVSAIEQGKEGGSATRSLVGTWEYMSPERQEGKEADTNDDCYAVALMAWKLLTGYRRPGFERASELSDANPIWDTFFSKALSMRKEKRFESAKQMSQRLEELRESLESEEKPVIKPTIDRPANQRGKEQKSEEEKEKGDPPAKEPESEKEKPDPPVLEKAPGDATSKKAWWSRGKFATLSLLILVMGIGLYESGKTTAFPQKAPPTQSSRQSHVIPDPDPESRNPTTYTNKIGMKFALIPSGSFQMGSPSSESSRDSDEGPVHTVRITRAFYLGKYEVTQGQWEDVMGANPSAFKNCGRNCPVESVSWNDVQEFIKKLNSREGCVGARPASPGSTPPGCYRLPTEAEWEYAARSGTNTKYYWGNEIDGAYVWYGSNSSSKTHPVGEKNPNSWGLYDMSGNVWEWAYDWFDSAYYQKSPGADPVNTSAASGRVDRGGGWANNPGLVRSANRYRNSPGYRFNFLGFRLLRVASP
jgi:formylglycine-generating enzyme required for sulfatase activity/tRNA A-37 threonylcarbamoyl transferase component Bud32